MGINIIATIGKNNELGKYNNLIWNIPMDLVFFEEMTYNKVVIMGRKTFETMPNRFPRRLNVVISSKDLEANYDVICFNDLLEALATFEHKDVYLVGGQTLYYEAFPLVDTMYLNEVNDIDYCAEAYFPGFDASEWNVEVLETNEFDGLEYQRKKYVRKK